MNRYVSVLNQEVMHAVISLGGFLGSCCIWGPLDYLKQRVSVALHCTMITLRKDSELAKQNMPSLHKAGPLSLSLSLPPSFSHSLTAVLNKHASAAGLPKTGWKWNSNPVFFCSWHCSDLYAHKKLQEKNPKKLAISETKTVGWREMNPLATSRRNALGHYSIAREWWECSNCTHRTIRSSKFGVPNSQLERTTDFSTRLENAMCDLCNIHQGLKLALT